MNPKQILYLGHWIIKLDWAAFVSSLNYAQMKSKRTKIGIVLDIVYCVLSYQISIMEYFQFNYFLIGKDERKLFVGTPAMRPYQLKINPKSEKANKLYYLPLFISVSIAKKVYSDEALAIMFDGHTKHSPDEMVKMLDDLITCGEKQHVNTPYLKQFKERIN